MAVTTTTPGELAFEMTRPPRSLWRDAMRRLMRNRMAVASIIIILIIGALAVLAPVLPLHPPITYQSRPDDPGGGGTRLPPCVQVGPLNLCGPGGNPKFPLGTDASGRDVLSRMIYGAQVSLLVGIIPMAIIVAIGLAIGMTAGFLGGRVDNLLMRFTDVIYAFPDLLFIIILVSALRPGAGSDWFNIVRLFMYNTMDGLLIIFVALSLTGWVGIARLVRGQVLSLKEKEFIEAARAIGVPTWRIILVHLLPNSLAPIIVAATFAIPGFIITEAILGYIGIGVRPPRPTWGDMVNEGYRNIDAAPHLIWIPAAGIAILTLAFTFLGDGLRDALDPRMSE
jgi:oligopeptide transport system permease protein